MAPLLGGWGAVVGDILGGSKGRRKMGEGGAGGGVSVPPSLALNGGCLGFGLRGVSVQPGGGVSAIGAGAQVMARTLYAPKRCSRSEGSGGRGAEWGHGTTVGGGQ